MFSKCIINMDPRIIAALVLLLVCCCSSSLALMMSGSGGGDDDDTFKPLGPSAGPSASEREEEEPEPNPFVKLGEYRLLSGKSGYPYTQFFVDEPANAVQECETACKNNSTCPGFSLDWHRGVDKVNCMVYQANNGNAEDASCVEQPFGNQCTSGVKGKPDVTEGGLWWRG